MASDDRASRSRSRPKAAAGAASASASSADASGADANTVASTSRADASTQTDTDISTVASADTNAADGCTPINWTTVIVTEGKDVFCAEARTQERLDYLIEVMAVSLELPYTLIVHGVS